MRFQHAFLSAQRWFAVWLCTVGGAISCIRAQTTQPATPDYPIDAFVFTYGHPQNGLPALDQLKEITVPLRLVDHVLSAPGAPPLAAQSVALGKLSPDARFSLSGLQVVLQALVDAFNRRGLFGVFVVPNADEIDPSTKVDYRPKERHSLNLIIWVSEVGQMRVIAKNAPVNAHAQQLMLHHSPIAGRAGDQPGSMLLRNPLETYLWRLNEQPGRHVEASVTSTNDPGVVALDFLVDQGRPWTVFAQSSNTGTAATGRIRHRLAFNTSEATGHDDSFSLDYFTTSFSGSQAVFASYERPLLYPNRLSARVFGSWGNFDAQPVGIAFEGFSGNNWSGGAELSSVLGRLWGVTVEVVGGVNWQHFAVKSRTFNNTGDTNLLLSYLSTGIRRRTDRFGFSGTLRAEANVPELAGTQRSRLENLGRLDTDAFWINFRGDFSANVFIDPFLKSGTALRANEFYVSMHGQYTETSYRLIPQELDVLGGFFSVRGYPESLVAGDSAYVGTAEYRFHIPRVLGARDQPLSVFGHPFRLQPRRAGGETDWDLIFRAFTDMGQTYNNRLRTEERNQSLLGAGSGLELSIGRYLDVRVDLGYALKEVSTELETLAKKGSSRVHAVATLAW